MPTFQLPATHLPALARLQSLLAERAVPGWLVGGYVRDLLLGHPGQDIDVAVDGPAHSLARELADRSGGAFVSLDEPTDSARVVWGTAAGFDAPFVLDLVRLRAPSIDADLRLRDWTINALAVPLSLVHAGAFAADAVLDPTGGRDDLARRELRLAGPQSLFDDPLRALRGVRLAAQLGLHVPEEVAGAMQAQSARLALVAHERVRDELLKLMAQPEAARWIEFLDRAGLLMAIVPELAATRGVDQPSQHYWPVLEHLFDAVRAWEWLLGQLAGYTVPTPPSAVQRHPGLQAPMPMADALVRHMRAPLSGFPRAAYFKLAVLLHDIAKPATRQVRPDGRITFYDHQEVGARVVATIAGRLRLSRDAGQYLQLVVREHMRPGQLRALGPELTRRALYRFIRDTGDAAPDVLLHTLCDHMAARGPDLVPEHWAHHVAWTAAVLEADWSPRAAQRASRLIDGRDIIAALGVRPGPLVGQILAEVAEAQFVGEVRTREEALALARQVARRAAATNAE